jgi:hypothetical protein
VVIGIAAVLVRGSGTGVQALSTDWSGRFIRVIVTKTPGRAAGAAPARELRDDDPSR